MNDPHHLLRMKEKEAQRRGGVDPATIIDWPTGLRCVMKTVAMNEKVISEIKKVRMTGFIIISYLLLIAVLSCCRTKWCRLLLSTA